MNKIMIKRFGFWILFGFCVLSFGFSASAATFSNPELTSVTDTSIVITWNTTDEASTTEILYGVGSLTDTTSVVGTTEYHYLEVSNLLPNTTYKYRLKSGTTYYPPQILDPLTFKTLSRPTGELLFSFAVFNGTRYAEGKSNTTSAHGIAYEYCDKIVDSIVSDINTHDVAFTVVNGNLAENSSTYGNQVGNQLKTKLETLTGASDLPSGQGYKYLPTPGYEDRQATYSNNWLTDAFIPITTDPGSSESRYGYVAADNTKNSIFNFQFKYKYYNFIFLDSTKNGGGGLVSVEALNNYLSAEANSKTFVFTNYPAYNPFDAATKDYPIDIPTSEVAGGFFTVDNAAAFRATLESYTTAESAGATQIPITAAVISGHIGDNYLRTIKAISYIRQAPSTAFPCGYSIYKVYTNGFIKTFYKTDGRDETDKPYYEHTRDLISGEGNVLQGFLQAIWLGSNSLRNFTKTYGFIPGVAPAVSSHSPASSESGVNLNKPLIIRFNKRMDPTSLNSWVTISPSVETTTTQFLGSDRTILQVNHSSNFTQGQTYTVTVNKTYAKDEGLTPMAANYTFSFDTTGGSVDTDYPTAYINPLSGDYTTDPYPSFTGVATGENGVVAIQYKINNTGNWISAEAIDGTFSSTTETFKIILSSPLATGSYALWIKTTDAAGNTSTTGFNAYSFTVAQENPEISSLLFDGKQVIIGDPIDSTPKIEITITAINSLESARLSIDGSIKTLSFVKVSTNYYGTYEATTALADGIHGITIEAFDSLGKALTYEVTPLYVQSAGEVTIQGIPLNYPNPYDPGLGDNTTIGYILSKPANTSLNIFDLSGNLVYKQSYASNEEGGKAGYNTVTWNGKSSGGNYVGNGIYLFVIIADGKVVQNGKGKITVFKQ